MEVRTQLAARCHMASHSPPPPRSGNIGEEQKKRIHGLSKKKELTKYNKRTKITIVSSKRKQVKCNNGLSSTAAAPHSNNTGQTSKRPAHQRERDLEREPDPLGMTSHGMKYSNES